MEIVIATRVFGAHTLIGKEGNLLYCNRWQLLRERELRIGPNELCGISLSISVFSGKS